MFALLAVAAMANPVPEAEEAKPTDQEAQDQLLLSYGYGLGYPYYGAALPAVKAVQST